MTTVKVSPKFQVVIPREIREKLRIRAGQVFAVFEHDGLIELVPVEHPRKLRGFAKGMDTRIEREDGDRL